MQRLLLMDEKNYDDTLPELCRTAVRAIIFIQDKMLFIEDNKGELKLPGGGIEEGEDDTSALIREVREETGCNVIPESIKPFGYIEEKRMSFKEEMIFHQFSRLYFCSVDDTRGETEYSKSEISHGMHVKTCTLDEAIAANRKMLDNMGELAWNKREYRTLLLVKENRGG